MQRSIKYEKLPGITFYSGLTGSWVPENKSCQACSESYFLLRVADQVIEAEKNEEFNPYLSTRVMSRIEEPESLHQIRHIPAYRTVT